MTSLPPTAVGPSRTSRLRPAKLAEGRPKLASVTTGIGDTFKEFGKRKPTA